MFALMVAIAVITFFEIFNISNTEQYDDGVDGCLHVIAYSTLFGFVIYAIFNWI